MKRVVPVLFVLLLIAAMITPVLAAEFFEIPMYSVATLPDFVPDDSHFNGQVYINGVYEGYLSEGVYDVQMFFANQWIVIGPVSVSYSEVEDGYFVSEFFFDPSVLIVDGVSLDSFSLLYYPVEDECYVSGLIGYSDDVVGGQLAWMDGMIVRFTPVLDDSKLVNVLTFDLMSGALDSVMLLFPVALAVLAGFIALRKAIAFVQRLLHSS